jgi:hypothetical protein
VHFSGRDRFVLTGDGAIAAAATMRAVAQSVRLAQVAEKYD